MENQAKFRPNPKLKLMDQVREVLGYHHYAYRTEQAYCHWILRYIYFFGSKTHPRDLDSSDVECFLSDLTVNREVSVSAQRQGLPSRKHGTCQRQGPSAGAAALRRRYPAKDRKANHPCQIKPERGCGK
ncbi:MAG: phage integrase N-terminal SAM-like domain-containing protein [Proteobacteria bacterium]|nr:phage integrase N-terminal SAM-like domain-containing protein [Pseudomonadota bacterium]